MTDKDDLTIRKLIKGRSRILYDAGDVDCIHGTSINLPCSDCEYETYDDEPDEYED